MSINKFSVGITVKIINNRFKDYGSYLGKLGTITFVGIKMQGVRTYLFKTNEFRAVEFRVYEPDLQ